ncbi:MAG TPA: hypothetical protein VGM03_23250 [Phycisphaerae bacterium]|jgi:predicted nucleotidyltransferase
MPIPDLNAEGYLPPGIHDCTLEEIGVRFGRFQGTERRSRLFERLQLLTGEALSTGLVVGIIVNGSFVTGRPDPNDIDLILVLRDKDVLRHELRPFEYNVLSRRRVRQRHGFDIRLAAENQREYNEYVEFFQRVKEQPERRKGLLRVRL